MRALLLLMSVVALLAFTGCETAWGGSPQQSTAKLKAKEDAKIQQMQDSGDISSEEAKAMHQSNQQRASQINKTTSDSIEAAGYPAGQTQ